MTDIALIFSSLKSRWLNSLLSVFLTAFGVMLALLIIQFGHHIQNRITTDGKNIDIVVGAKGSPLQLILSSVYHIDIPTGNIAYDQAQKWMKHPHVKTAIPLALGDNWKGYRIVGTTPDYLKHYQATILEGRVWNKDYEAIAGSSVGLQIGEEFSGAHGLIEGGHKHDSQHYTITGIIEPTGTVLDRLILTSMNSVLDIHGLAPASPASRLVAMLLDGERRARERGRGEGGEIADCCVLCAQRRREGLCGRSGGGGRRRRRGRGRIGSCASGCVTT